MALNGREGNMISREEARLLLNNYQNSPAYPANNHVEGILFGRNHISDLLSQAGCEGVRIYYGKTGPLSTDPPQLVLVGTDLNGNDMTDKILDAGVPCPDFCSSESTKL